MILTQEHAANYKKLATYLLQLPKDYNHFDMEVFCTHKITLVDDYQFRPHEVINHINTCDTVACALGHGPVAGIKAKEGESWFQYGKRVFGTHSDYVSEPGLEYDKAFEWCFSGEWHKVDNTPHGAGRRILYMLKRGVPLNHSNQINGFDPISY